MFNIILQSLLTVCLACSQLSLADQLDPQAVLACAADQLENDKLPRTRTVDYGVGFSLSLDYGVASIYFRNGSTVDVAKIEGGPAYKQMMRGAYDLEGNSDIFIRPATPPTRARLFWRTLQIWTPAVPQLLCGRFNVGCEDAYTQSLLGMLKVLKTASESFLEAPLSAAEVVFPFPILRSHLDALRAATFSLSLKMPLSAQPPAGILAARAYGIGSQEDSPDQLILSIDYSRAALTALLIFEGCGVFENRRVLHDVGLGTDELSKLCDTHQADSCYDKLVHALRLFTHLPLEWGNGDQLRRINKLVLLGESANNGRLREALEELLGAQLSGFSDQPTHTTMVDPLFAASKALAEDCLGRLNFRAYDPVDREL